MDTLDKAVHYDAKVQELDFARTTILKSVEDALHSFVDANKEKDRTLACYARGEFNGLLSAALYTGVITVNEYRQYCDRMIDAIKGEVTPNDPL